MLTPPFRCNKTAALWALLSALAFDAQALPTYSLTDLGDLPGGGDFSQASALNSHGQVTGWSGAAGFDRSPENWNAAAQHAFIWTNGAMQDLGTPTAYTALGQGFAVDLFGGPPTVVPTPLATPAYVGNSYPHGINDQGQVIVDSDRGPFNSYLSFPGDVVVSQGAYLWSNGNVQPITGIIPADLNNQGQIAGAADGQAAIQQNGANTSLGQLAATGNGGFMVWGESPVRATAINNTGMVAGVSNNLAFAWTETAGLIDLNVLKPVLPPAPFPDLPPGAICACIINIGIQWNYSGATDLNDLGEIVGYSSDGAFLWKAGQVTYLQDGAPGSLTASAINNQSQVVGKMDAAGASTGFLWSRADGAVDINSLLFDTQGWTVTNAADINDAGQIAATGIKDGVTHALLLTPLNTTAELSAAVPVPAAVWLFGSALAGLGVFGRRRLA